MTKRTLGLVMNGVTGRMGKNQHLVHSILAIREAGGVALADGTRIVPEPILVGRNAEKLQALAQEYGLARWTTDLDAALADPTAEIYFDGGATLLRQQNLTKAIAAGKHVYCEKPSASNLEGALEVYRLAAAKDCRHGVVQDKLWAPGMLKLRMLLDSGFFGRVLAVRVEGCYWVFEGDLAAPQRPSWNARKEDGGGMILDMMPHYRYMVDLFGSPRRIVCLGATHVDRRWDESGRPFTATADDSAYAIIELENGVVASVNSSWCFRVRRDDIVTMQVDGTLGSAVAGLRQCFVQRRETTPRAQWSLDLAQPIDFYAGWQEVPDQQPFVNAFRAEWELFIRHVCEDGPFPWTLAAGARGVQLAELADRSWREGRWMDVPDLGV
jgi:predicted dehydrogenase